MASSIACTCYRTGCVVNVGGKGHGLNATPLEGFQAKYIALSTGERPWRTGRLCPRGNLHADMRQS